MTASMTAALYAIGFALALVLTTVLCYLRDLRLYREEKEREPVGDHGLLLVRRVIRTFPKPPLRVKALGVMQVDRGWGVLYSDGRIVPGYKTAEEAREVLRIDNATRP